MLLRASVIALAVLSPLSALAQGEPPPAAPAGAPPAAVEAAPPAAVVAAPAAPAPAPAPAAVVAPATKWYDTVAIDGLVDAYYMYNFTGRNSLQSPVAAPGGPTTIRSFDVNSNAFSLNYAKLGLGIAPSPVGLRLDLGWGATGIALGLVEQAFATLVPVDNLTIDFGKFDTTAGAEVIQSNKNWLYSRSILFSVIPLVHTGLRVGYAVDKTLSLQLSVVNGYNGVGFAPEVNAGKTFGLSVNYTAPMGLNAILTSYIGKESVTSNDAGPVSANTRVLVDLVVAHTIANIGLNLNIDYLNDKGSGIENLVGFSAMAHIPVNEHFALNARGEFVMLKVPNPGAASTSVSDEEFTVGGSVPFGGRFEFRPELRFDNSNQQIFNGTAGPPPVAPDKKNQFTGTAAFLAWF